MKALTIHQPYAHLIVTPQRELPVGANIKRVGNREWQTGYRGDILVHAGESLEWFDVDDWPLTPSKPKLGFPDFPEMAFGAIVGRVRLVQVYSLDDILYERIPESYNWLKLHEHTMGAYCWVLDDVRRFVKPIPYRGLQGLSPIPNKTVDGELYG